MYLSKLTLDPRHLQVRRDLADAYEMHRTLARVFAPDANTPPPRFLWRLEPGVARTPPSVLIQAPVVGSWTAVEAIPGYVRELRADKKVSLETLVEEGRRYRFRLYANPTVTRAGKRLGLMKEDEQLAWLDRQGQRHGFTVLACLAGAGQRVDAKQGSSGNRIVIHAVPFDGLLEATEPGAMREAIRLGLGHAKALGLGLLSLAPA